MYRGNPHQGMAGFEPPGRRMPTTMPHETSHRIGNDTMRGWFNNFIGGDTGVHESVHGPLAELTQDQMGMMQNMYNNPRLPGAPTREELWNKTKAMEKKGIFGFFGQEPTTTEEFNDYYNRLLQGEQGDKGAYWIS